jgi:hypothetical protein
MPFPLTHNSLYLILPSPENKSIYTIRPPVKISKKPFMEKKMVCLSQNRALQEAGCHIIESIWEIFL